LGQSRIHGGYEEIDEPILCLRALCGDPLDSSGNLLRSNAFGHSLTPSTSGKLMALSVQSFAADLGADIYWEEEWHVVLESHLPYLTGAKTNPSYGPQNGIQTYAVDPHDAFRYDGDLWGYLQSINQQPQYWWPIMRASGMYDPNQFNRYTTELIIPSVQFIDSLRTLYQTVSNKLN
jgi:hypothetical protein